MAVAVNELAIGCRLETETAHSRKVVNANEIVK